MSPPDRTPPTGPTDADATQPLPAAIAVPPELANHPRYHILAELGRGGMGVVYKAEHTLMGRTVALKVVNPEAIGNAEARARFLQEIRTAARLEHDNVVRAYEAEVVGDRYLLAMEYVDGQTLEYLVTAGGRLPVASACDYARQTALGLQFMHERGLVHRDIKPQNLMVTPSGRVKLLDVGLSRSVDEDALRVTQTGVCIGTPHYIAPEQALDTRTADIRSDIYSLGCTLYYMLSGRTPFDGQTPLNVVTARLTADAPPLDRVVPGLPAGLSKLVAAMMARDPSRRPATPADAARMLEPYCQAKSSRTARATATVEAAPTPRPVMATTGQRSSNLILRQIAVRVAAVLALVILLSGVLWPEPPIPPPPPSPFADSPQLLTNPGGEQPVADGKIPGWTADDGTWAVRTDGPTAYEGQAYFAPNPGPRAELTQDVDVSPSAAAIDAGTLEFEFVGYVRTAGARLVQADTGRIVVEYRDAADATVLVSFDTAEIASRSAWKRVEDRRKPPPGTRRVRVRLIGTRHGVGSSNDGYFDGLSLKAGPG